MPQDFTLSHTNSFATKRNATKRPSIYRFFEPGASRETAAPSAKFIKEATGTTEDKNYWIKFPNGQEYEVYCIMSDAGGGWMNINTTFGPYSGAIFNASTGAGSRNMIGSVTGNATQTFVGPYVTHNQAAECGNCTGSNCPSRVAINSTLKTEMGLTEFRMKGRVSSTANYGSCPYFGVPSVTQNVAGTKYTGCAINADMGPFIDVVGNGSGNYIVYAWSVCAGSSPWTGRIEGLYVR